jgi:hypothetical protein
MSFENFNNSDLVPTPDIETSQESVLQAPVSRGFKHWLRKNAALFGIVGLGIGVTAEADAKPFHPSKELYPTDSQNYVIEKVGKEQVGEKTMNIYIVKDLVNNLEKKFNADSDKEAADVGPVYVQPLSDYEKKMIETERAFQQSGLSNKDGIANSNYEIRKGNHVEERHFEGFGIERDTKVEVSPDGKIVRSFEKGEEPLDSNGK